MTTFVAAAIGALVSLVAVVLGAWLNGVRERHHWLRDQKLHAAIDFLYASRHLLNRYQQVGSENMDQGERGDYRRRMQMARSAIYLVCGKQTVELADVLSRRLHRTTPEAGDEFVAGTEMVFSDLTASLRKEVNGVRIQPTRKQ